MARFFIAYGDDFFIVARTDPRQLLGLNEAISRGIAFKAAGATPYSSRLRKRGGAVKLLLKRVIA
jgi:2-methylisocitrate lyase-like PEP mutase family enzyme